MNELQVLIEELISFLEKSNESVYADRTPKELIKDLKSCIQRNEIDNKKLKFIILPTNSLQDTSIDNGWRNKFCDIASKIEHLVKFK